MEHAPIPSNRYLEIEQWPSHNRGPIYTRPMAADFNGAYQYAPMFVFPDGRAMGATETDVLTKCRSDGLLSDADCAQLSRDVAQAKTTNAQALCQLECEKLTTGYGQCVSKCFAQPQEDFIARNKLLIVGGLAILGILVYWKVKK